MAEPLGYAASTDPRAFARRLAAHIWGNLQGWDPKPPEHWAYVGGVSSGTIPGTVTFKISTFSVRGLFDLPTIGGEASEPPLASLAEPPDGNIGWLWGIILLPIAVAIVAAWYGLRRRRVLVRS